ncbi:MAG: hypothetical protein KGN37_12305 [Burkholderiales bacterium]|nr:hypothetical protein [Burkholderiales bacterium]
MKPDFVLALFNLGNVQEAVGDLHGAVGSYSKAVALNPDSAPNQANLGRLLHRINCLDDAVRVLRIAVDLAPDNMQFKAYLERVIGEGAPDILLLFVANVIVLSLFADQFHWRRD